MDAGEEPTHAYSLRDAYEVEWTGLLPTHGSTVAGDEAPSDATHGEAACVAHGGSTTGAAEYYDMTATG